MIPEIETACLPCLKNTPHINGSLSVKEVKDIMIMLRPWMIKYLIIHNVVKYSGPLISGEDNILILLRYSELSTVRTQKSLYVSVEALLEDTATSYGYWLNLPQLIWNVKLTLLSYVTSSGLLSLEQCTKKACVT